MDDVNTENEYVKVDCTGNIKVEKETKENANAEKDIGANAENRIAEAADADSRVAEAPDAQSRVTEEPKAEIRVTEEPKAEIRVTEEPKEGIRVTEDPKAEIRVTEDPNAENLITEHNAENEVMKESQNEMEENANAQNKIAEAQNAENEVRENAIVANEGCIVVCCTRILKEKLKNKRLFRNSNYFALEVTRYMRRCYEISKRGSSDIEDEDVEDVEDVVMLEGSTRNYSRTHDLGKYLPIGSPENRHKILEAAFYEEMIYSCNNENRSRIIILCALCFLAAFDLQETPGFENSVNCATDSLARALFLSDSYWIDSDDDE